MEIKVEKYKLVLFCLFIFCAFVALESSFGDLGTGMAMKWIDISQWPVEGRAWEKTEGLFDRLPKKAKKRVSESFWKLATCSAGLVLRFEADNAEEIWVDYDLKFPCLALPHMPATGVSGIDLYEQDAKGQWRWLGNLKPMQQHVKERVVTVTPKHRNLMLYFPLYNGVNSFKLGVKGKNVKIKPLPCRKKPIVFYGTSITQGACASRPGMAYTAILGRWLDMPIVNLGFSGSGIMDEYIGKLMAEIDAGVYVIDCLPNMTPGQIAQNAEPLVRKLRSSRPKVPIILVEDRDYANAFFKKDSREGAKARHKELKGVYDKLMKEGFTDLYYIKGDTLLGDDGEASVDGSHPSDLGMVRISEKFKPVIVQVLEKNDAK